MQLSLDLTLSFSRHSSMCVYVKVVCVLVLQKPLHQTVSTKKVVPLAVERISLTVW